MKTYASIYTLSGSEITVGLRTCDQCDEAIKTARQIARDRGESMHLIDSDGEWIVHTDGTCEEYSTESAD